MSMLIVRPKELSSSWKENEFQLTSNVLYRMIDSNMAYPQWRQVVAGFAGIVSVRLTVKPAGYSLTKLYFIFHFMTILKGVPTKKKSLPVPTAGVKL